MTMNEKESQSWAIDLANFSGPLDVLLHLIQTQDLDVFDIPIAEITAQYIDLIHANPLEKLTLAGDYLVMAATLIEIKTKMMLPKSPETAQDETDDPRRPLVEQLLAYQQYKALGQVLNEKHEQRLTYYERPSADLTSFQQTIPLNAGEITTDDMISALQQMIQRLNANAPKPRTIHNDAYSVAEAIDDIEQALMQQKQGSVSLFAMSRQKAWTRHTVVTLFLAILQLVKGRTITIVQDTPYSDIYIKQRRKVSVQ